MVTLDKEEIERIFKNFRSHSIVTINESLNFMQVTIKINKNKPFCTPVCLYGRIHSFELIGDKVYISIEKEVKA